MAFGLTGDIPICACANCGDMCGLSIVPYKDTDKSPMIAIIVLCSLCLRAMENGELGANLEVQVAGQKG